jgi:N-acetylglucosaminyldiphosphoundecaprenol N-acetyl-beta-D-mannosaminyltransferase
MKTQIILGVPIINASEEEVSEYVFDTLIKNREKSYIVTPNPEILVYSKKHSQFEAILNKATLALPDGFGLMLAGKVLGTPLKQRITGVDFMENLCKESVRKAATIGLLGAGPGVAEKTAECLRKMYPGIKIVFAAEEWREEYNDYNSYKNYNGHIDILFVAFGYPKQEEWISQNLEHIPVTLAMGVGGAFDYISGEVTRAPAWLRGLGLEWLFRLITQPWRWRRQRQLVTFIQLVIRERLKR